MAKQKAKINDKPSHVPLHHTERSARKAEGREEIQTWEDEGGAEPDGPQVKEPSEGIEEPASASDGSSNASPDESGDEYAADGEIERPRNRGSGGTRDGAKRAAGSRNDL
jgi:hypothetical protein